MYHELQLFADVGIASYDLVVLRSTFVRFFTVVRFSDDCKQAANKQSNGVVSLVWAFHHHHKDFSELFCIDIIAVNSSLGCSYAYAKSLSYPTFSLFPPKPTETPTRCVLLIPCCKIRRPRRVLLLLLRIRPSPCRPVI